MALKNNLDLSEVYDNKRILITGASGYIAWSLIRRLVGFNCTIICYSRKNKKIEKQSGLSKFEFIDASYQDETSFQKAVKNVDIIYHLASQTSVYEAEKNPLADCEANVRPMQLLLEACRKEKTCPIIIFSATSTQCGMPEKLKIDENVPDRPITTYDFHKLQAENWLKFYTRQGWVKGVSFRLTNVYGPGPKSSSSDRGILNLMIKKALNGKDLTVYGTGEYIRDYIYIDDVLSAFLIAPLKIDALKEKHFVLGSGKGSAIQEAVLLVGKIVNEEKGGTIVVKRAEPPANLHEIEYRDFTSDTSTFCAITGWEAEVALQEGIRETIASILETG
jgi:nucleoside-diphosphate-sugar epimerase